MGRFVHLPAMGIVHSVPLIVDYLPGKDDRECPEVMVIILFCLTLNKNTFGNYSAATQTS